MPPTMTIAPKRITKLQAARRLGVSVKIVRELIRTGDLKEVEMPVKVHACILESSVDALIARTFGDVTTAG